MAIISRIKASLWYRLHRAYSKRVDAFVVRRFHQLWHNSKDTWRTNKYLGHRVMQLPLDMWLYQEIIFRTKPAFNVQTGISRGGGLLFFAHLLDAMNADPEVCVVGIDIRDTKITIGPHPHPRIRMIFGSSVDPDTIDRVKAALPPGVQGMVSLDSDHRRDHVLREMELYSPFVAVGAYMVVEDTNINGQPVRPKSGPGPAGAVTAFLTSNTDFVRDDLWKRNLISFHQGGWLKRVK